MLYNLHQHNQYILLHKSTQWKELRTDSTLDIAQLHTECDSELLQWLKQLENGSMTWEQVHANLCNLRNIKEQLEETPWNYLPPKNTPAQETFTEDLLFYFMICSLLHKTYSYFQSHYKDNQRPAKVSLLPTFDISGKKIENLLKPYLDTLRWLRDILIHIDVEYLHYYNQLVEAVANLQNANVVKGIIKPCISTLTKPPVTHKEELKHISSMKQLIDAIDDYNVTESWSSFRTLLAFSVPLSGAKSFTIEQYSQWIDDLMHKPVAMEDELLFWKQSFSFYKLNTNYKHAPPTRFFEHLIKYIKKQLKNKKCSRVCSHYARYDGTPMHFARHIYQFIERRQIEVNNSRNLKDLTRFFYDMVFVKNSKSDKRIDFETIYSYVRRYSNGELE
ncbi:MAG: hypothetical protein MI866_08915 [Bacteroidales bacterium]|nr:hypothetical protein [Bacteroidales bacterium]